MRGFFSSAYEKEVGGKCCQTRDNKYNKYLVNKQYQRSI